MALEPLKEVADSGIPVLLVPGNHERSEIPFGLLTKHPNLFVFDKARTFEFDVGGMTIALSGFPFVRNAVRESFRTLVDQTGWREHAADAKLLCVHQSFEGATVGPVGYTFKSGPDVVRLADIPDGLDAVLSGHIHRAQVLTHDLEGHPVAVPVLYPGSTERTSFAERDEIKGYMTVAVDSDARGLRARCTWEFQPLGTRPMVLIDVEAEKLDTSQLSALLVKEIRKIPADAVAKVRLHGLDDGAQPVLQAASLRRLAPETMNLSVVVVSPR
jgi:DNA repair exonuclease SbcCD nuclease subunit